MLAGRDTADVVGQIINETVRRFGSLREPLRRSIAEWLSSEMKYGEALDEEMVRRIERIHDKLVDTSFHGRLLQFVGPHSSYGDAPFDFSGLAAEAVHSADLFLPELDCLHLVKLLRLGTSGKRSL